MKTRHCCHGMASMTRVAALALAVAAFSSSACNDDQLVPRADFRRPTGLVFIERPVSIECPATPPVPTEVFERLTEEQLVLTQAVREDSIGELHSGVRQGTLLVADSEAEGVRVQHYQQIVSITSTLGVAAERLSTNDSVIVPGPTVFFPLVLSARGFPTQVVVSKDQMVMRTPCTYPANYTGTVVLTDSAGNALPAQTVTADLTDDDASTISYEYARTSTRASRGFVLALAGGDAGESAAIYVLDTRQRPFLARSDEFLGFAIDRIDLGANEHTAGPWTTTDLQVVDYVPSADCAQPIEVTDPLAPNACDEQGHDILVLVQDPIGNAYGRLVFVIVPRDGSAPTFVPVRLNEPAHPGNVALFGDRLVVSNADPTRSELFDVRFAVTGTTVEVLGVNRIDVGGPTSRVVDGGPLGVFAIRIDQPRMVHLVEDDGVLVPNQQPLSSPFQYPADENNRDRNGQIELRDSPVLTAELGQLRQLNQAFLGVVLDALDQPNDFVGDRAPVLMVAHADGELNFVAGQPPRLVTLQGNAVAALRRLEPEKNDAPELEIVGCDTPNFGEDEMGLVLDPDGPIPACFPTSAEPLVCSDEDVRLRSTGTSAVYWFVFRGAVYTDESGTATVIEDGRRVVIAIDADGGDAPIREGDSVLLQAQIRPDTDAGCELRDAPVIRNGVVTEVRRVQESNGTQTATAVVFDFDALTDADLESLPLCELDLEWFEVYPSSAEGVLTVRSGARIEEVLQRVPTSTAGDSFSITFEGRTLADDPLDIEFSVQGSPSLLPGGVFFQPQDRGRICLAQSDCLDDFVCVTADEAPDELARSCFNRCEPSEDTPDAVSRRIARVGVELSVTGSPLASVQLSATLSGVTTSPLALPADAVFAPMRRSWLISVPGTRALAEVLPQSEGIALGVIR